MCQVRQCPSNFWDVLCVRRPTHAWFCCLLVGGFQCFSGGVIRVALKRGGGVCVCLGWRGGYSPVVLRFWKKMLQPAQKYVLPGTTSCHTVCAKWGFQAFWEDLYRQKGCSFGDGMQCHLPKGRGEVNVPQCCIRCQLHNEKLRWRRGRKSCPITSGGWVCVGGGGGAQRAVGRWSADPNPLGVGGDTVQSGRRRGPYCSGSAS